MKKQDVYDYLKTRNIWYEIDEHKPIYNMKESSELDLSYPSDAAKNLFVRDDKKNNYYLITVKGYKRVDLKKFRKNNNTRPLTFASSDDLNNIMG